MVNNCQNLDVAICGRYSYDISVKRSVSVVCRHLELVQAIPVQCAPCSLDNQELEVQDE